VITNTILILLGIALAVVLVLLFRPQARQKTVAASGAPLAVMPAAGTGGAAELLQAKPGDVISIHAAAEDFSDLDFTVDRRSAYESAGRRWTDLSGDFRGRRVYLEVQPGPEPEVMGLLDGRKLTLADVGTTEEYLAEMDQKQNPWLYLEFEGKRWQYESSREIGYFENEQGQGAGLYRWLLREPDGARLLCIEKWEGEPFDVRIARRLSHRDINVYPAA
jgi:hypothetical protein